MSKSKISIDLMPRKDKPKEEYTIDSLAKLIAQIQLSDRWALIGVSGEQGEGKSCFTDMLARAVAHYTKTSFSYKSNMTYRREQLKTWIDGDKEGKGQLPEYSVLSPDELISMFFSRTWYDDAQIEGIELFNKCRDRHLAVIGNIPVLWHLDSALLPLIRFWVHIDERGTAWVFQKSNNPWAKDKWYCKENEKLFNKYHDVRRCKGYVATIEFRDWTKEEKAEYYAFRNEMRKNTEGQRGDKKLERYGDIKGQRDELIKFLHVTDTQRAATIRQHIREIKPLGCDIHKITPLAKELSDKHIADLIGVSDALIGYILRGER